MISVVTTTAGGLVCFGEQGHVPRPRSEAIEAELPDGEGQRAARRFVAGRVCFSSGA